LLAACLGGRPRMAAAGGGSGETAALDGAHGLLVSMPTGNPWASNRPSVPGPRPLGTVTHDHCRARENRSVPDRLLSAVLRTVPQRHGNRGRASPLLSSGGNHRAIGFRRRNSGAVY